MRRFFVEEIDEGATSVSVRGEEFVHLKKVLRLKAGGAVAVFNGRGLELTGVIESIGADCASIRVDGRRRGPGESPVDIALIQGLVKGPRMDIIVQKATELGVSQVRIYSSARTVPLISEEKSGDRLLRLRRIAIEAAKQCGRSCLPLLSFVVFEEALTDPVGGLKLLFWEGEKSRTIKEVLRGPLPPPSARISVLTGPEGGLSKDDASKAVSKGFIPVGLGPRVLRAETAAVAAVSIIQYELGDMS